MADMVEQLGLGIVLSLEDNFTQESTNALDSFNRLQNGAENLVSSIQNQMLNMRNIMMTGFTFKELGESVENSGQKMLKSLEDMGKGFIKVNADYQTAQAQLLTSFKGNAQEASKAFDWIRDYSANTPFEVSGMVTAFQKLKSSGIDIRDSFKDATGETRTLAEAIGDLSTRNMGGTGGVSGMGYAIQEAWAGQFRSLVQRFDVAKQDLEGMKKYAGTDAQKFSEEFIKVAEKYAPNAMRNMGGTWQQTMSNMHDMWNNFVYDLGKTGVFTNMNLALADMQKTLNATFSDKRLINGLGQAINDIVQPILWLAKGLAHVIVLMSDFTASHPMLAKVVLGFMGIAGAVLTVTGFLMKMAGGVLLAIASLSMLQLNMQLMGAQGLTMMSAFGGLGQAVGAFASKLGILGLAGTGLFVAWEKDLGGLKTSVTTAFSTIVDSVNVTKMALANGFDLKKAFGDYSMKATIKMPPLVQMFSSKFLKIVAISKAFWDVITGHFDNGVMHFSKQDWDLFKATGIEGLVRGMVYAREKIDMFFKGFTEGLGTAVELVKSYLGIIWLPIKAIYDAVEDYAQKHPNGLLGSLFLSEKGADVGTADALADRMERIGKVLGTITGLLVGMKIVSTLNGIISKPFKGLFSTLGKVGTKIDEVKTKLMGFSAGGTGLSIAQKVLGKPITQKGLAVAQHFKDHDRTTQGVVRRDGKYNTVGKGNVDPTYYQYHAKQQLGDGEELQVKRRSAFAKMFLGEQYYAKGANGSRRSIGSFGGILHMDRDDRNIRNMATNMFSRTQAPIDNSVEGQRYRVNVGDPVAQLKNMGGIESLRARQNALQGQIGQTVRSTTALSNSQYDRYASVRQRAMGADYAGLANQARTGNFNSMQDMLRYQQYQRVGFDERNLSASERLVSGSQAGGAINNFLRQQRAQTQVQGNADYQRLTRQARTGANLNQNVFADNRQNAVSRALFGQRLYTVSQDARGNYNREDVGRRGGLLRRQSNDMRYSNTSTVGNFLRNNRATQAVVGAGQRATGAVRGAVGAVGSRIASTTPVSRITAGAGAVGARVSGLGSSIMSSALMGRMMGAGARVGGLARGADARLQRAGFRGVGARVNAVTSRVAGNFRSGGVRGTVAGVARTATQGAGAVARGAGRFMFGSTVTNAQGQQVRRAGAVQRVAGGAIRGVGAVGRGIGAVGGLAMRAMPYVALGSMAYKGISNMGAGKTAEQKKQLGVSADAGNFQTGMAVAKKAVAGMDFSKMWATFKKEGGGAFNQLIEIAKVAWTKLKPMLPQIMSEAWEGIKAMAGVAWEWIKTDGVQLLGQMADGAMKLLGVAWEWIKTDGATMFGQFVGDALVWIGELGAHIIKNLPEYLMEAVQLAGTVLSGLLDLGISIFSGLAGVVKDAFFGALEGLGNFLLGALSSTIRAVPVIGNQVADFLSLPAHHGGLWMSDNEHMAVIRKDETVLPPDVSKELNSIVKAPSKSTAPIVSGRRGGGAGSIDNSMSVAKAEIIVQATGVSQADARTQALKIWEEFRKIKREKQLRGYSDVGDGELAF